MNAGSGPELFGPTDSRAPGLASSRRELNRRLTAGSLSLEQVQEGATDAQHLGAVAEAQVGGLVVIAGNFAHHVHVHHDGTVHLPELRGIELFQQGLQGSADQGLAPST